MNETSFQNLSTNIMAVLQASNETDSTLLITGGTGTGKSHMAFSLHRASAKRGNGRFFKVNLATLSENLIESELFGHERGAFTGADTRRIGRLETCNNGTVFLDEIGELPLRLQAKLLDFIQYKKIWPVGSNREIELDVRIIAATNRNLEAAVKAGEFRADLYHRLNVFHVRLPDLAMNPKAVIQFAKTFLIARNEKTEKHILGFSKEVEQVFRSYGWPGNIRELENTVEYAVSLERTQLIGISALPPFLQEFARHNLRLNLECGDSEIESPIEHVLPSSPAVGMLQFPMTMDFHESKSNFEKLYLEQALRHCNGQINLTSRRIGLNKVSLTEKIKKYCIDWRKIRIETLGPRL